MFWEKIKKHNLDLLVSQIEQKGGKADATVESVLDNLKYLADEEDEYDEKNRFLRLDVRRTLASLCDTGRLVFVLEPTTIKWAENMESVSLAGYLYEVKADGTEIRISSLACGGAARQDVYSYDEMSNPQRQAMMFSLASARAESNAYYNSGIGIEYKGGDVFDLEAFENRIPAPEPVMPATPSQEEKKQKRATRVRKAKAETAQEITQEATPVPETATEAPAIETPLNAGATTESPVEEMEIQQASDITSASSEMSFEDAMKVAIDVGSFAGKTIGEILSDPRTARNIVWCFKQEVPERTPEVKKALSLSIEGYQNGVLKRFL